MSSSPDSSALTVTPLPAFNDNYLWLLARGQEAAVVDPGDAAPVQRALDRHDLRLTAILVTHHHGDHVGGVLDLKARTGAKVFGPAGEDIEGVDVRLRGGKRVEVLGAGFQVIDVPGHTAGHIAYFAADQSPPLLICGDTLFACGCGRLFEGTARQMLASLDALAALPPSTLVYCAHEYTLSNIRFALEFEPGNAALRERAARDDATRRRGEPTVPSTIGLELATNPFLRCDAPEVRAAVALGTADAVDRTAIFALLRKLKDNFR
ncbi:MAG: hydroxyacylglutathione hydrolase [Betaproteobacteria bacterium]